VRVSSGSPSSAGTIPAAAYEGGFVIESDLLLECGRVLVRPTLHYAVYGEWNAARDNGVLVCHALSGSALVAGWWPGLFTSDESPGIVDLRRDCVICVNLLGSCYGSTGPASIDPGSGAAYGPNFPLISIADNVRAQALLMDSLGIQRFRLAIGGSIGGMQALDWTVLYPQRVERAVIVATSPLPAMGLALNHLQRQAITSDPEWNGGRYEKGVRLKGLALARAMGMLSYKSAALFRERFARNPNRNGEDPWALGDDGEGLIGGRFDVAGFLDYQGERFLDRFDANAYLSITRTMDTWEPGRGFGSSKEAFSRIEADLLFVGISSDWLFPAADVRRLAEEIRDCGVRAEYREMATDHGHDAFLAEQGLLVKLLEPVHGPLKP
jgi:homoserine O-acetyltransferase/O-succinyltransferase